jgi:hypothetical protein
VNRASGERLTNLLNSSFDQAASLVFLGTFFLCLDAVWIDIIPVPVALAIVVITRGRLGYRPAAGESPDVHATAMATMALAHET